MVIDMRIFKNKKTGKKIELDEKSDKHLIKEIEGNNDWKELIFI